jgi:hypothetical protein
LDEDLVELESLDDLEGVEVPNDNVSLKNLTALAINCILFNNAFQIS